MVFAWFASGVFAAMKLLVSGLVLLVLISCGACGNERIHDLSASAPSVLPSFAVGHRDPFSPTGQPLPLEPYYSVVFSSDFHRTLWRLTAACVEKRRPDLDLRLPSEQDQVTLTFRRYAAVYDTETAKTFGYHVPGDDSVDEAIAQQDGWGDAVSVFRECSDRTRQKVVKGLDLDYVRPENGWLADPVRSLNLQAVTSQDPKVVASQVRWSECMAGFGYDIATTLSDLPKSAAPSGSNSNPSQSEIAMALHDVECQDLSGVVAIQFEVESAYQREQIRANPDVFAEILAENREVLARAGSLAERL